MKTGPECLPCILNVILSAIRRLELEDADERELVRRILEIPALRGRDWETTAPQVIESALVTIGEVSGDTDPFRGVKARQNEEALKLLPWLRDQVARSEAPLQMAVRVAAVGNAIDLMTNPDGDLDVVQVVRERLAAPLPEEALDDLEKRIRASRRIVFLGDNCGEVVFDRVLVERIQEETGARVTYVVRGRPALNDVTLKEAEESGMTAVTRVVSNGADGPLAGTILSRCSDEVRGLVAEADLVISKGGGNFDSLEEEPSGRPTAFLVQTKCRKYQARFGTEIGRSVLHLEVPCS